MKSLISALAELERERTRITAAIEALRRVLPANGVDSAPTTTASSPTRQSHRSVHSRRLPYDDATKLEIARIMRDAPSGRGQKGKAARRLARMYGGHWQSISWSYRRWWNQLNEATAPEAPDAR